MTPRVSVCVTTRNRADRLPRLLAALSAQTLPPTQFEVVVVDDASTDDTSRVLTDAAASSALSVAVYRNDRSAGIASARNVGWRAASGDVVAFTDDDCVPDPGWLEAGVAAVDAGVDVVVGRVERHLPDAHRTGPFARELVVGADRIRWYATANIFYRRAAMQRLGGFDEQLRSAGEDTELGFRAERMALRIAFAEDALVYHEVIARTALAAAADQARWADLAGVFARHPDARRSTLFGRVFWRRSHAELLLLLAGLTSRRPALATASALPWLHGKLRRDRRDLTTGAAVAALPGLFLVEAAEVAAAVRGSVRHRTLFL